jgi:hypothetical protein
MKSSLHSLIHFLWFLLNHLQLRSPELNTILNNNLLKRPSLSLYNPSAWTTHKTQHLYCWESLFTDPLPSNGHPIVVPLHFHRNVFTKSLPSNGSIHHNIIRNHQIQHPHVQYCDMRAESRNSLKEKSSIARQWLANTFRQQQKHTCAWTIPRPSLRNGPLNTWLNNAVMTSEKREDLVFAVMICSVCESVKLL